jgi:hypothetical protein
MKRLLLIAFFIFSNPALAQQSKLPPCPSSGDFNDCFGSRIISNGGYMGEFKNNSYHGQGTRYYSSLNTYIGKWKNGEKNGDGSFLFSNGDKYIGTYKDDERVGEGKYVFSDGTVYEGEFEGYSPHGIGVLTNVFGDKYAGEFLDGKRDGYGILRYQDGYKHTGIWSEGRPREGRFFMRCGNNTYSYANQILQVNNKPKYGAIAMNGGSENETFQFMFENSYGSDIIVNFGYETVEVPGTPKTKCISSGRLPLGEYLGVEYRYR